MVKLAKEIIPPLSVLLKLSPSAGHFNHHRDIYLSRRALQLIRDSIVDRIATRTRYDEDAFHLHLQRRLLKLGQCRRAQPTASLQLLSECISTVDPYVPLRTIYLVLLCQLLQPTKNGYRNLGLDLDQGTYLC